jgi:hypothetical protein
VREIQQACTFVRDGIQDTLNVLLAIELTVCTYLHRHGLFSQSQALDGRPLCFPQTTPLKFGISGSIYSARKLLAE